MNGLAFIVRIVASAEQAGLSAERTGVDLHLGPGKFFQSASMIHNAKGRICVGPFWNGTTIVGMDAPAQFARHTVGIAHAGILAVLTGVHL